MAELNALLQEKCEKYLSHQIRGKEADVGTMLADEKKHLYPLPGYPLDCCKRSTGRVDRFCTVRFDTNNYSVIAARIDRLTFRSHVLDMNGDSYRLKATMQKIV